MPITRFREKKGTIAGCDRKCSDVIRAGLLKFYHYHGYDPVASGNSLRGFPRDLLPFEAKEVRLGNEGRLGNRAGDRALDDDARQKNLQKTIDSIERGKKKQAAQDGGVAGKRHLEDEGAGPQEFNPGPRKRGRRGQVADAGYTSWNEQYTGQFGAPTFEDGPNGHGVQESLGRYQEDRNSHAPLPPQGSFNAFGTSEAPYQYPNLQAQSFPVQNQTKSNQRTMGIGTSFSPARNELQKNPYDELQMQPGKNLGENNDDSEAQRLHYQWKPKPLPTGPRRKDKMPAIQAPSNNKINNQKNYPAGQFPQRTAGIERSPNVGPGEPHQAPRGGKYYESVQSDRHNMAHNGSTMNVGPRYPTHGQRNNNDHVPGGGNTLGPGGRKTHQAPKQILGKRGERDAGGVENDENKRNRDAAESRRPVPDSQKYNSEFKNPAIPNETQQEQANVQVNPDPDVGSSHKRRRNNAIPGTDPKPQRQHLRGNPPRPRYYGAGGAPESMLPSEGPFGYAQTFSTFNGYEEGPLKSPEELEFFPTTQPDSGFNGDAGVVEGPLLSPEELYGTAPYDFQFDENAEVQGSPHGNTPSRDVHGGSGLIAATNDSADRGMSDAHSRHSEYIQRVSEGILPQQVLGKHGREEPSGEGQQDTWVSEQNRQDQGPKDHEDGRSEDTHGPKPKRRHMPTTEGYYSPPAHAPKAAMVQKARKAERDAHLPPPLLNMSEPIPTVHQAPRVEDADLTPREIYINGTAIDIDEAPLVADGQGIDPPRSHIPARTDQEAPSDIRDVRPVNAWQSQSLNNSLRYTRENFSEWTGEQAPVTNLEDCYNVQYRDIRAAFRIWWRVEKNPLRSEPLPKVWRMKAWSGSVEDWKAPTNMEHLEEPMRRGRWAARNRNGSLQKPEFHWNAEKYQWYESKIVEQL